MTPTPDLKRAFDTLVAKRPRYDEAYMYYDGQHPLRYSTERLREAFANIRTYFAQNWVAVVIDSVLDRLVLKGFDISGDETLNEAFSKVWQNLHLSIEADDIHEAALVCGEGFLIIGKNEDGEPEAYFNDPRMCHVFYDEANPHEKAFAVKLWKDKGAGRYRLNLYYPDRIEHYITNSKNMPSSANSFQMDGEPEQPQVDGEIPVFHFKKGRRVKAELTLADISLQDAVNKTFSDMMVAAEFSAFKQRIIISQTDPGDLTNAPNRNWWIPSSDGTSQAASVQELGGSTLDPFLGVMDKLASSLAIITRTPKHYFFMQGGDPSGDALLSMEAPLIKKVTKRQEAYGIAWAEAVSYLLKLSQNKDIDPNDIKTVWEPVATTQPEAQANVVKTMVDSTIPLKTALRRQGWSAADLKQMDDDIKEDKKNKASVAAAALEEARKNMEQNNDPTGSGQPTPPSMPPGTPNQQ